MQFQLLEGGVGRALPRVLEQVHQFLHVVYWALLRLLLLERQLQHQHAQIILGQKSVKRISLVLLLKERNVTQGRTQRMVTVALALTTTFTKCSKLSGPANGNIVGAK